MKIKYAKHLIKSKGISGIYYRSKQIIHRFGFTSKKIEQMLEIFINITDEFNCKPTLCITAALLTSYPEIVEMLNNRKAELAFHGYIHTDYTTLSPQTINKHLINAKKLFKKRAIHLFGFRLPYLRCNKDVFKVFGGKNFLWSSNKVICWDILERGDIVKKEWNSFQRVINELYMTRNSSNYLSLPKNENHFIEIPISVPDDEIIIDRLRINNEEKITQIWQKIFIESYRKGELFTLQTHHERLYYYQNALRSLLREVKNSRPKVWTASLQEIAEWWKERRGFKFKIIGQENNCYHIKANCSDRATVLVKKYNTKNLSTPLFNHYDIINDRNFIINCDKKPFIGISEHSPQKLINFLLEEGFMLEISSNKEAYAVYLEKYHTFDDSHEKDLIDLIEDSPFPLIRFWRWPEKAQSALAITGDIDCITIIDFFKRYFLF